MSVQVDLPDALLTADRIRQLFSITEDTLRNWISGRKLPSPVRIGNRCYWDPRVIQEFLDQTHPDE